MKTKNLIGIILFIIMIASVVALVYHHPNIENNNLREVPPGKSLLEMARFMTPDMVELSVGETKEFNITAETRKNGPGEVTYSFFRVKRVYSDGEIPMPDGLNVSIEPSTFMAYPNETYNSTLTINTSRDLPRGEYRIHVNAVYESTGKHGGEGGVGTLTINMV